MKLNILTIILDGEPWIEHHLTEFEKLSTIGARWHWHIVHGAAMNKGSTKWCRPQAPRLSMDGTCEYLNRIRAHPRVSIYESSKWESKDAMVNAPLGSIKDAGILMQVDSDELWSAEKLAEIIDLFTNYPQLQRAYFKCDYYVGPDIITMGDDCYGNNRGEWLRAWRFFPGMKFDSHEPPVLAGNIGQFISRDITADLGLKFKHMAYATEKQVALKEHFYGYKDAVKSWKRLQANTVWPTKLKPFLQWVDDRVMVHRI